MALHNVENFLRPVEGWKEKSKEVQSLRKKTVRGGSAGKNPCLCLMGRDSVERTYFEDGYWTAPGSSMESPPPPPL